jgi:hypothetical protein
MALGKPDAGKPPVRFDEGRSRTVIGPVPLNPSAPPTLQNITTWERLYLKSLRKAHEGILRGAIKDCLDAVIEREDPPFDARVARSEIQEHLNELKSQLNG